MNVWRMILKEIAHRKVSFVLGTVSVLVASACLVGELTLLGSHDARTRKILTEKQAAAQARLEARRGATKDRLEALEAETAQVMAKLEDDIRKSMVKLGFNIHILPKGVELQDVYAKDYADKYMPEEYATRLANSRIITINHLLPSLRQRIEWPEQGDRAIILIGVRGEVPILHRDPKKPMLYPVPPNTIVLGYQLHQGAGVKVGDTVTLKGRSFTVSKCHGRRLGKDDITAWVNLSEAQEMLGKQGKINEMLALKCHCAGTELDKVRSEISNILPDTQILEFASRALARAEARSAATEARKKANAATAGKVKQELAAAVADEQKALEAAVASRAELRETREELGALILPLVLIGVVVWIGYLAFTNARDRSAEVGVLRALGVRSSVVTTLFLGKAVLMGLLGAVAGYFVGGAIGRLWGEGAVGVFDPVLFLLVVVLAPALACLASWVPTMLAAQQDPASVLSKG